MFFTKKKLTDDELIAAVSTAMNVLSMETELLTFPSFCTDWQLVPTEAYYRGLIEGFVIGIMAKHKFVKFTGVDTVQFTSKGKKIYDHAIPICSLIAAFHNDHAAFYWTVCYQLSDLKLSKELFAQRLSTAILQDSEAYFFGRSDAFYQVSIANTGMLKPTRNFQRHIAKLNQSRLDANMIDGD